jgi:hypothetical protein
MVAPDLIAEAAEEFLESHPPQSDYWKADWLMDLPANAEEGSVEWVALQILVLAAITARARGGVVRDADIATAVSRTIVGNP